MVALLSDLSNSDTVTSVAEGVQLACFASEVNQCPKDLETDHVWERLLVFLQHLSRSKVNSMARQRYALSTRLADRIKWLDEPVCTKTRPTQLCTIVEECSPECIGCDEPHRMCSSVEEIERELDLALETLDQVRSTDNLR